MRTKRFEEYIKEGYKAVPDDYNYFRRMIIDPNKDMEDIIEDLILRKPEWVEMLIKTAKNHWGIGNDKGEPFPEKEYYKIINKVIDKITMRK